MKAFVCSAGCWGVLINLRLRRKLTPAACIQLFVSYRAGNNGNNGNGGESSSQHCGFTCLSDGILHPSTVSCISPATTGKGGRVAIFTPLTADQINARGYQFGSSCFGEALSVMALCNNYAESGKIGKLGSCSITHKTSSHVGMHRRHRRISETVWEAGQRSPRWSRQHGKAYCAGSMPGEPYTRLRGFCDKSCWGEGR